MTPILMYGTGRRATLTHRVEERVQGWWRDWISVDREPPPVSVVEPAQAHWRSSHRVAVAGSLRGALNCVVDATEDFWRPLCAGKLADEIRRGRSNLEQRLLRECLEDLLLSFPSMDRSAVQVANGPERACPNLAGWHLFRMSVAPAVSDIQVWLSPTMADHLLGERPTVGGDEVFVDRRSCIGELVVDVEGVVGDVVVRWGEVRDLRVGDVIVTGANVAPQVELRERVTQRVIGTGMPGICEGRMSVRVELAGGNR